MISRAIFSLLARVARRRRLSAVVVLKEERERKIKFVEESEKRIVKFKTIEQFLSLSLSPPSRIIIVAFFYFIRTIIWCLVFRVVKQRWMFSINKAKERSEERERKEKKKKLKFELDSISFSSIREQHHCGRGREDEELGNEEIERNNIWIYLGIFNWENINN